MSGRGVGAGCEADGARHCPIRAAVQRAAAEEFVARTEAAARTRGVAFVALSGGSTPRGLHTLLADPAAPFRARVPWERLHVFWGTSAACRRIIPTATTGWLAIPCSPTCRFRRPTCTGWPARIRIRRGPRSAMAASCARSSSATGGSTAGWPRFDVVILGMGADGHTASLFPGTDAVHETARPVVAVWVAKLGAHRITLTPPVLNRADAVLFLVTGPDKAETLAAVLEGPPQPDVFPSQIVQPTAGARGLADRRRCRARLGARSGR